MNRIFITVTAAALMVGGALAQQSAPTPAPMSAMEMKGMDMKMMMPSANDTPSTKAYKAAMMQTMQSMPTFSGDADIDFMKHMRPHHQAAIEMAKILLANGKDTETKKLAQDIITAQEKEIAVIDTWLKKKGV
jgi:uncharacterized protein (DUF305 family)